MDKDLDPTAYQPMIDAILGVADSGQITAKKIRSALQELFSIDLSPHKKQINDFIVQRYHALEEKLNHEETEQEAEEKRMREEDDRTLAQQLESDPSDRMRAKNPKTSRKPPSKSVRKVSKGSSKGKVTKDSAKQKDKLRDINRKSPFHVELLVSNPLQQVVGQEHMSRPIVVKRLWEYIKKHELQDSNDRRRINCDAKLQAVFKKTFVGMFEMNRLLGSHLFKDGELVEPRGDEEVDFKAEVKGEPKQLKEEPKEEPKEEHEVKDE